MKRGLGYVINELLLLEGIILCTGISWTLFRQTFRQYILQKLLESNMIWSSIDVKAYILPVFDLYWDMRAGTSQCLPCVSFSVNTVIFDSWPRGHHNSNVCIGVNKMFHVQQLLNGLSISEIIITVSFLFSACRFLETYRIGSALLFRTKLGPVHCDFISIDTWIYSGHTQSKIVF